MYMESYTGQAKIETEITLHQKRGWTTKNRHYFEIDKNVKKKFQEKLYRKIGRNCRNKCKKRWRQDSTCHRKTIMFCGNFFSCNTKVKDKNGNILHRKIKSINGSVQYSVETSQKTQQISWIKIVQGKKMGEKIRWTIRKFKNNKSASSHNIWRKF